MAGGKCGTEAEEGFAFTSNAFIPLQLFARLTPSGPAGGMKMRRGEKSRRRMAGWERMEEGGRG